MLRIMLLLAVFLLTMRANAELNLKPVHPDEPTEYTYNKRFSIENSLRSLSQIRSALKSFRKLTNEAKAKLSKDKFQRIGNTDPATQDLGFMNWAGAIEGTLYKNDYVIKKLQYELTMEKVKSNQLNKSELEKAETELRQAEQRFQDFWNSFGIGD